MEVVLPRTDVDIQRNETQENSPNFDDKENLDNSWNDLSDDSIRRQCEFYFSDANVLKDAFILRAVKASSEGWVALSVIENFKKMQRLTQDHVTVVRALSASNKLEVSEDGTLVRRREPLPPWDPTVYHRTIIITDFPEGAKVTHNTMNTFFTTKNAAPLLVRIFMPSRKIPSDLKRSQTLHPQLGVKLCVVVEFDSTERANNSTHVARELWPGVYAHLLSRGSKKANQSQSKKKKDKDTSQKDTGPPAFLLNRKFSDNSVRVVHIREPIRPPNESSVGFSLGWRDSLRLHRLCLSYLSSPISPGDVNLTESTSNPDMSISPVSIDGSTAVTAAAAIN